MKILKDSHRIMYQINNYGTTSAKKQEKTAPINASPKPKAENSTETVSSTTPAAAAKVKTEDEKLKEAIRDIQVSFILK